MEMQDKSSFENEWEKAFAEAKSTPPNSVWDKLEIQLANSASGMYEKKLNFFKMLAAASIFLAVSIAGISVYHEFFHQHKHDQGLAENIKTRKTNENLPAVDDDQKNKELIIRENDQISDLRSDDSNQPKLTEGQNTYEEALNEGEFLVSDNTSVLQATNENNGQENEAEQVNASVVTSGVTSKDNSYVKDVADLDRFIDKTSRDGVAKKETLASSSNLQEQTTDKKEMLVATNDIDDQPKKVGEKLNENSALVLNQTPNKSKTNTNSVVLVDNREVPSELVANKEVGNNGEHSIIDQAQHVNGTDDVPEMLNGIFEPLDIDYQLATTDLQMVPWEVYAMDNKVDYKKLWAGVGLSRGSFDPNGLGTEGNSDEVANFVDIPTSAPTSLIAPGLNSSPSISDETQGSSLNIGVNVGAQIAKRWVIQAGISYLEQNTSSSSNAIAIDNSNRSSDPLTEFNDLSRANNNFVVVDDYTISNSYKSVSVPIQAGYILLNRKFNITLLGGVSNDFLVTKSIADNSGNLETVVLSRDEVTNINSYNISGIVGSEFGYNLGKNYSISLSPQVRQSLNTFNQGNGSSDSRPLGLEVGFRFKYLFN